MAGRHNLEIIRIMDDKAVITEHGGPYEGQDRYECRRNVIRDLEAQGCLVGTEPYTHNIGQCYRCKTDIEPAVSRQWFVKIAPLAKEAISAVVTGKTRIIPSSWEATYFEWMNNIRDWCISRQIWWGHRIPVWTCEGCGKVIVASEDPAGCPACGSREAPPGGGRPGHLVQLGALALLDARVARSRPKRSRPSIPRRSW